VYAFIVKGLAVMRNVLVNMVQRGFEALNLEGGDFVPTGSLNGVKQLGGRGVGRHRMSPRAGVVDGRLGRV
jgi:hypothetical protein